jgi:CheY-specific phosphatase CheX
MSQSAIDTLTQEFEASLAELIRCYTGDDAQILAGSTEAIKETTAAIVGFGDESFRGSAVLLGDAEVVARLAEIPPSNPVDWLGELSNQLVGRLKNKLSRFGLLPQMGTPVTLSGKSLDLGAVSAQPTAWQVIWENGSLRAILALEVAESLELVADETAAVAEEGSLSLF